MSVRKEDNGTWSVRCWYRDWRGERKQKTKRGFLKQKDAKEWERNFLSKEQRESVNMSTLIEAYKQYMYVLENMGNIKASTRENKLYYIERYIDGYFKSAPVENITPAIIDGWLAKITAVHCRKKRMSSGTIRNARSILSQIFEYGKKNYGIKSNPVKESSLPSKFSNDARADVLTQEQFQLFYNTLKKEIHKTIFLTLYWSGLRIGELLALTSDDIKPNTITVNKTWIKPVGEEGYASDPKTESSTREIIIPDFVYQQLQKYIATLGPIPPNQRIFPILQCTVSRKLINSCRKLCLPKVSLHTLRHSYATNFIARTNDYVTAAAQLGHASPEVTLKIYSHKLDQKAEESLKKFMNFSK